MDAKTVYKQLADALATMETREDKIDIDSAIDAINQLANCCSETWDSICEVWDSITEFLKDIKITEFEKYEICRVIGFPRRYQRNYKLWRKNRALFRPYKRNI